MRILLFIVLFFTAMLCIVTAAGVFILFGVDGEDVKGFVVILTTFVLPASAIIAGFCDE